MRSNIGRPIDPRHPTNLAILLVTLIAIAAGTWHQDLPWGLRLGAAGFLAWALTRELDPDHPYSAFLSATLALGLAPLATPGILTSFWALLALRMLNRSPGTPTQVDAILTIILALWASWQGTWIAGILTAAILLADARLPEPGKHARLAPVPLLGILLAWPHQSAWGPTWIHASIALAIPMLIWNHTTSRSDRGTLMHPQRVMAAVVTGMVIVLVEPVSGIAVASALAAGGLWRIARRTP